MTMILVAGITSTSSARSFAYRISNKIFEVALGIYRLRDNNFICEIARLPPRVSSYLWHGSLARECEHCSLEFALRR